MALEVAGKKERWKLWYEGYTLPPPHPYFILMNPQRNELITPWVILLGRKAFPGLLAQTVAKSSDRVGEI